MLKYAFMLFILDTLAGKIILGAIAFFLITLLMYTISVLKITVLSWLVVGAIIFTLGHLIQRAFDY